MKLKKFKIGLFGINSSSGLSLTRLDKRWKANWNETKKLVTYCDKNGKESEEFNPNGALRNIAGIFNKNKNILGMMPHPERVIDKSLSSNDGNFFFENLIKNLK